MSAQFLIVASFVVVAVLFTAYQLRGRKAALGAYWHRGVGNRAWSEAFPSTRTEEIERFVSLFADAFAFPHDQAAKFLPSDSVFAIYRALYPSKELPDALELETFARSLKQTYGLPLAEVWSNELTLGQIFNRCRVPAA